MDAFDPDAVAAATGWRIVHLERTGSTNDDAARLRDDGVPARTAVVADAQLSGRGRAGRGFASPVGGLYASLLLRARPADLPARTVALAAVAMAEVLESVGAADVEIKWPNDVWIARRKVAGILLESVAGSSVVVAGIGLNVDATPAELPPEVARAVSALAQHVDAPPSRAALLTRLLERIDAWQSALDETTGAADLERAWLMRLALRGERVRLGYAGDEVTGVFEAASLTEGLLIRDDTSGPTWRDAALAHDLRPA